MYIPNEGLQFCMLGQRLSSFYVRIRNIFAEKRKICICICHIIQIEKYPQQPDTMAKLKN